MHHEEFLTLVPAREVNPGAVVSLRTHPVAGLLATAQTQPLPPCTYSLPKIIRTLRLSGGAGKKREAPLPKPPAKKHAPADVPANDGADAAPAEVEEKPDVSRNWDVQKVAPPRSVSVAAVAYPGALT